MIDKALFSSAYDEWETPRDFFDTLDKEFHFTLDAASSDENALCEKHFTKEQDALKQSWQTSGSVWCNPPYGREIGKWMRKAFEESRGGADSCHARTRENGHKVVSRMGLRQGGIAFRPRAFMLFKAWRARKSCAVSVNGRDLRGVTGCM